MTHDKTPMTHRESDLAVSDVAWPFCTDIRVRFGHEDHAQVVYFPTLFHYFQCCYEDFFRTHVASFRTLLRTPGIGFPLVHVEGDFRQPLRADDLLRLELGIERVGATSLHTRIRGHLLHRAGGDVPDPRPWYPNGRGMHGSQAPRDQVSSLASQKVASQASAPQDAMPQASIPPATAGSEGNAAHPAGLHSTTALRGYLVSACVDVRSARPTKIPAEIAATLQGFLLDSRLLDSQPMDGRPLDGRK